MTAILGFGALAWLLNRRVGRTSKPGSAISEAEQRALTVANNNPSSDEAVDAWQEVLRQGRELNDDFVCGKALVVLGSASFQRKEFFKSVSYCDDALKLPDTARIRDLLPGTLLTKALAAEKLGQDSVALDALLEALRLNRESCDIGGELEVVNRLGTTYHRAGNRAEAEKYFKLTLKLARETGNRKIEARALHNLGTLAQKHGQHEDGLALLQQALEIKRKVSDVSAFETMNAIGSIHYKRGAVDLAEGIWMEALMQARKTGKPVPALLGNIAELKFARGKFLEAIELRKEALKIRREAGDLPGVVRQLGWIGGKYLSIGELDQGRDYCEESLKMAESTQNRTLEALGLQNLGTYYSESGDLRQAIALNERALTLHRETSDERNVIGGMNNLANYARLQGDLAKAEALLTEALCLADRLCDCRLQARTLNGMGVFKRDAGEPRAGLALVMRAAEMEEARKDRRHECAFLANAASIEIDLGQTKLALEHASRAAELAQLTANREVEVMSILLVGGVYRERGELEKAREVTMQAAASAEKIGSVRTRLSARKNMGLLLAYEGDFDSAVRLLSAAAYEAHRCGFYLLEAAILADLSSAEIGRGEIEAGIARAQSTLKVAETMGVKAVMGNSWHAIGTGHQQLKQYDSALDALRHSLTVREIIEHCRGKADTQRKLAEVHLALGDLASARTHYRKCLDGFTSLGNKPMAHEVEAALKAAGL
jgi:tetratricopeptide (TPR) repeat protein